MREDTTAKPGSKCRVAFVFLTAAALAGQDAQGAPSASAPSVIEKPGARDSGIPQGGPARIRLAEQSGFAVQDISGPPGEPLPVRVNLPPEEGDLFRVVMFRGLPEGAKLTEGVALDEAWAVSPEQLEGLALVAPEDFSGTFQLDVIYIHGKGDSRQKRQVEVRIARQPMTTPPQVSEPEEKAMLARSREMLETGDVAGARLVLDYLARHGSAGGAFALAQTYDPQFLESLSVRGGVRPDMAKALKWYRKAAELGSEPASTRLTALQATQ